MQRIAFLILFVAVFPALALAGDGPILSLSGTAIAPVESSDAMLVVAAAVDAGADIQYCWSAIPGTGGSPVASYRYGWDVLDPGDPDDPGWAGPVVGFDGSESCSPVQSFLTGSHAFVVQVTDEAVVVTRVVVQISVNEVVPATARSWSAVKGVY